MNFPQAVLSEYGFLFSVRASLAGREPPRDSEFRERAALPVRHEQRRGTRTSAANVDGTLRVPNLPHTECAVYIPSPETTHRALPIPIGLMFGLLILATGCTGSKAPQPSPPRDTAESRAAPPSAAQPPRSDKVDVLTGPFTSTILSVVRDQKPFILMDMAPELARLKGYTPAAQEEYLVKRALMAVRSDNVWKKKEYEGKDSFVVRMILLMELDEYGKPKWGSAMEIALVEVPRGAVAQRTREAIAALDRDQARKAIEKCRFSLENIEKAVAR
jgi:hypothetical protein